MADQLPPCKDCGGALQRVEAMPGHVVCGSGHLYLEHDARRCARPDGPSKLERIGEEGGSAGSRG